MAIRTQKSLDNFIIEKRKKENWGLLRIHKWLSDWDNNSQLDEIIVLVHLLDILGENNLIVSKREILNCFNKFYNRKYHGDKISYLKWLYDKCSKKGSVPVSNNQHRSISETKETHRTLILNKTTKHTTQPLKASCKPYIAELNAKKRLEMPLYNWSKGVNQ